ncbi:MAG: ABC transporter permease [Prevotella sp.]|nr:ABC transporter permease [Prevotella sp.]
MRKNQNSTVTTPLPHREGQGGGSVLPFLLQKEFLQIRRNSFMPKIIFIFPIMVMCVMPWVMNQEVKNIRVDVVDIDHTTESQQIVHRIEASNYFIFNGLKPTYEAAMKDIESSQADIILEIRNGQYLIAANAVNGTKGSIGSSYLSKSVASPQPLSQGEGSGHLRVRGELRKEYLLPSPWERGRG